MSIAIQIEEIGSRAVSSRRAIVHVGTKTMTAPFYGTLIKKRFELERVLYPSSTLHSNPQLIVMKIYEYKDIILNAESRSRLKNLQGEFVDATYRSLRTNKVWLIDPVSDEYYYNKDKDNALLRFKGFSESTKSILRELNSKTHAKVWKRVADNETQLMGLIKDNANAQADGKVDVIMSPSPLLTGTDPDYMIDVWYKVVKATAVYSTTNLDKPSTISINVHKSIFNDRGKLDLILSKLINETTEVELGDIRLITLKILDSDLESETDIVKGNYRYFVMGLANYAKATKRLLILMNTNVLGLISIAIGADGFVEPVDGRLGLFGYSSTKYGNRYSPDALRSYPFAQWKALNPIYAKMTEDEWNMDRRLWLLRVRDGEIEECHKAIIDKTIYLGIKDKLKRSSVKNYLDIII